MRDARCETASGGTGFPRPFAQSSKLKAQGSKLQAQSAKRIARRIYFTLAQTFLTGHSPHRATRAVHTSAPSSISAWLCVHVVAPVRGRISRAIDQIRF